MTPEQLFNDVGNICGVILLISLTTVIVAAFGFIVFKIVRGK